MLEIFIIGKKLSLVGGSASNEGNVYIDGAPLCHKYGNWDWEEAQVVCRHLGYNFTMRITGDSYFGGVPDWYLHEIAYLSCNGKENSINDCSSNSRRKDSCTNTTGVGVFCSDTSPSRYFISFCFLYDNHFY